jgi:hypothetical protein
VAGLGVERTGCADQEVERRQVLLGHIGVEQHPDDRGLHARALDAVRLYRVDESIDGEPLEHHDAPGIVDTRDQLAHPYAAELPVSEFRRRARRGLLAAGHAEHRSLKHGRFDVLSLRRAGGAAGQNLKGHTAFDGRVVAGGVAPLQSFDGRDDRRCQRNRHARTACPLGGGDDFVGPILAVGDDCRQVQLFDVVADRLGRLEGVDHRDGSSCGERADDRSGVRQSVADHETDGVAVRHARLTKGGRDRVAVCGDVVARIPAALELDARLVAVAGQPCREGFGKAFRHALTIRRRPQMPKAAMAPSTVARRSWWYPVSGNCKQQSCSPPKAMTARAD